MADQKILPSLRNKRWRFVFAALGLLLAVLLFWPRGNDHESPFAAGSVDFSAACEAECITIAEGSLGHGAESREEGEIAMSFRYLPSADDDIAQWGDCLDSVLLCWEETHDPAASDAARAGALTACVTAASCPASCGTRFAAEAGADFASVETLFLANYIDEGGFCTPGEG